MKTVRRAGLVAASMYLALTLAAYAFYPQAYSPLHNWLSDLGNSLVNTKGAVLYNAGCISAALLLIVLYVGLNAWRTGDRVSGLLLSIGQASGMVASLALTLSAVFNIGTHPALHGRCSMFQCIALTWFLSFATTALWRCPGFRKSVGIYGFLTAATVLVYGVFFNAPLGEWIAFSMFICYVILLSGGAAGSPIETGGASAASQARSQ